MALHVPAAVICLGRAAAVGTIDETVVFPSIAPRVGYNPGAYLVLVLLAIDAVAVDVKLYAVIVAYDGHGMAAGAGPFMHVAFADHTQRPVGGR